MYNPKKDICGDRNFVAAEIVPGTWIRTQTCRCGNHHTYERISKTEASRAEQLPVSKLRDEFRKHVLYRMLLTEEPVVAKIAAPK